MKLSGLGLEDVELVEETVMLDGFFSVSKCRLRHRLFNGNLSSVIERQAVERSPSIGVLLFDPVLDAVILVEQFRIGPYLADDDPWLVEIVAGIAEPGETLAAVAYREVKEETNCRVKHLIPISNIYLSPGASCEKMMIYCGVVDSEGVAGVFGLDDEGEDIQVHVFPLEKAHQMVNEGKIANAPAVIAIQWLKLNHQEVLDYGR